MDAKLTALVGGETFLAHKLDGSTQDVTIRQLPVREFPAYLLALEDEPAMVELFTGQPKGWSDSLTPHSFTGIVERGEALNEDFFLPWVRRRLDRQEKLMPGITARLAGAVQSAASTSQTGSQKSPSPPG